MLFKRIMCTLLYHPRSIRFANSSLLYVAFSFLDYFVVECLWDPDCLQEDIHCGIHREDGTISSLSDKDLISCAVGRERLFVAQRKHTYRWMLDDVLPHHACVQKGECIRQLRTMKGNLGPSLSMILALDHWQSSWEGRLCLVCETYAREDMQRGRHEVWSLLPEIFDRNSWDSVRIAEMGYVSELR